jgi:hypothetical protein
LQIVLPRVFQALARHDRQDRGVAPGNGGQRVMFAPGVQDAEGHLEQHKDQGSESQIREE